MSDEFEITVPVVRGEGVGVPIGEIQRAINVICQQMQTDLNLIASGGFPLTDVDITGGTITGVAISNSTGVTQTTNDNSTLLATDQFVNQQIIRSTTTVPLTITGGTYNQATLGSGFQPVVFTTAGVVTSILTIAVAGSGYAAGDLLTLAGGNVDATLRIATVGGGGSVTSATILYGGTGYSNGAQLTGTAIPPGDRNVELTGTLTSNVTFIIANGTFNTASRRPSFANNTTGAFTVTVFLSNGADGTTGSGYVLPQGTNNSTSVLLQTDGETNVWPVDSLLGLGAGTMATQNANNVAITGGTESGVAITGDTINSTPIGATTPSTGAFTTLSASSTVSGTGFSTYLASPPAIGGTAAAAGSFTNLSSSGTVSGTGFSTYLASPPAIGGTAAAAGAFTTLSSTGNFTPSQTAGIVGTTTNNNANAGSVGEVISSSIPLGSAVALSNGVTANIASISLTAGDWQVWGNLLTAPAGTTTQSIVSGAISLTTAAFPTAPGGGAEVQLPFAVAAGTGVFAPVGQMRVSVASTTTVFLVVNVTFAVSTNAAYGFLGARRVR
jgi:hypothetical protein